MIRANASWLGILLLLPLSLAGQGQPVPIKEGFVTGNHYLQDFSEAEKHAYLMGLADGILASPLLGLSRDEEGLTWFERCDAYKNSGQLQAIVDRFLEQHPERWHQGMGVLLMLAMRQACGAGQVGTPDVREPRAPVGTSAPDSEGSPR